MDRIAGAKVLIVDDASDLREVYQVALEHEGYRVKATGVAETGLAIARDWRPDLVLTDIFMPGIGGLGLITAIRSDLTPPLPAIVALSGFPDAREEALRRGALRFVTKPLELDGLLDLVGDVLAGHGAITDGHEHRSAIDQRRAPARAMGEATLDAFFQREPGAVDRIQLGSEAIGRFFGHSVATVIMLRDGKLNVCASSAPERYPRGSEATDLLSLASDVVESKASLLLPDLSAQAALRRTSRCGIRFLACVPYLIDRVAVGALCLVDNEPHQFLSSELAILEYVGRHSSTLLVNPLNPRVLDPSGVLSRSAFDVFLSHSIDWVTRGNGAMGVTLLTVDELPRDGSCIAVLARLPGPRMGVGALDRHRVAVFSVAEDIEAIHRRLKAARDTVGQFFVVEASAELVFSDPVPNLPEEVVLRWADDVLLRASQLPPNHMFLGIEAGPRDGAVR